MLIIANEEPFGAEGSLVRVSMRTVAILILLGFSSSCASTEKVEPIDLPFHVGVKPVKLEVIGPAARAIADPDNKGENNNPDQEQGDPGEENEDQGNEEGENQGDEGSENPGNEESESEFSIVLDAPRLEAAIRQRLEEECFAQVTILPSYEDSEEWRNWKEFKPEEEDWNAWDENTRERYWIVAAHEARTDMFMNARVTYAGSVEHGNTGGFSYNLLLFLLGGPFCYWVDDQEYRSPVNMNVSFFDTSSAFLLANSDTATLGEALYESQISTVPANIEFEGEDYDFVDRNGGDVGMYGVSLVCPSGFLSKENERIREQLIEDIVQDLASRLAAKVRETRDEILSAPRQVSFTCDLDEPGFTVVREADGRVRIAGDFVVTKDRPVEGLTAYRVLADGVPLFEDDFGPGTEGIDPLSGYETLRYSLDQTLSPERLEPEQKEKLRTASLVQIEVAEQAHNIARRTYTFPIKAAVNPEP